MTDGILLLPWLRSLADRHRRQAKGVAGDVDEVLRDVGLAEPDELRDARGEREEDERIWLHCVLGVAVSAEAPEEAAADAGDSVSSACGLLASGHSASSRCAAQSAPPAARRRGFDALLDAGLTPDEVAQMRRQFYASRGEEVPDRLDELASGGASAGRRGEIALG